MKTKKQKKPGRPRKPAACKKSTTLTIRLRETEAERLRANAAAAELTVTDLIVERCCHAADLDALLDYPNPNEGGKF